MSEEEPFDVTTEELLDDEGLDSVEPVESASYEVVKEVSEPHLLFAADSFRDFLRVVSTVKTTGANIYDKSILIRPTSDPMNYELCYSGFGVFCQSILRSTSVSPSFLYAGPLVVEVEPLLKVMKHIRGDILFYVNDKGVYASVLGGRVFVPCYVNAILTPFEKSVDGLTVSTPIDFQILNTSLALASIAKANKAVSQRLLFFNEAGAFVVTPSSVARLVHQFPEMVLHPKAAAALKAVVNTGTGEVMFAKSEKYNVFSFGGYRLLCDMVSDAFPRTVLNLFPTEYTGVTLSPPVFCGILSVLDSSTFEGGMLEMEISDFGVKVVSKGKDGASLSTFNIGAPQEGGSKVSLHVKSIVPYLPLLKGAATLKVGGFGDSVALQSGSFGAVLLGKSK